MSLVNCIAKLNKGKPVFSDDDIKELRSLANQNIGKMTQIESERYSVKSMLDEALADQKMVSDLIREAAGIPAPKVEVKPVAKAQPAKDNGVYETKVRIADGVETRYAVPAPARLGFRNGHGDELYKTRAEADAALVRQQAQEKSSEEHLSQIEADKNTAEQERTQRMDIGGFGADLNALQRGKVIATLNNRLRLSGEEMSLKDAVQKLVDAGEKPNTSQSNVIKDMSRTQWNRADQRTQDAHTKKQSEAGKKTDYYVGGYELGKTAHDYAEYLLTKEAEKPAEPIAEKPVEPWQMTKADYLAKQESEWYPNDNTTKEFPKNSWASMHRDRVSEALDAGKPVPAEVLAEYPNLKTKETDKGTALFSREQDNSDETIRKVLAHTPDSLKQSLLDVHDGQDKAALSAMMDTGKVKVITEEQAKGILGDKLFSIRENLRELLHNPSQKWIDRDIALNKLLGGSNETLSAHIGQSKDTSLIASVFAKGLDNLDPGHIARAMADIRKEAEVHLAELGREHPDILYSKDGRAQGFFNPADGTSNFIADNIPRDTSKAELRGLVRHEISVHALALGRDSAEFQGILKQVDLMRQSGNKKVVDAFNRVPADTAPEHVREEALAYLTQHAPELGVVQRAIAWFRNAIRAIGQSMPMMQKLQLNEWAAALNEKDLQYMAQTAMAKSYQSERQPIGEGVMASRANEGDSAEPKIVSAWKSLSENEDIFRYPKSESKDLQEVFAKVAPGFVVEPDKSDADIRASWKIYPEGQPEKLGYVLAYRDGRVELNIPRLREGDSGSAAYSAVGNWAFNTGQKFASDRFGMNPMSVDRRIENITSLALKFGSTDFLDMSHNNLGIKWKNGDDQSNLHELLKTSYDKIASKLPEIQDYEYDYGTGRFVSTAGESEGLERHSADITELVNRGRAAGLSIGEGGIKKAILTGGILRTGSLRDALRSVGNANESGGDEGLKGILYSRTSDSTRSTEAEGSTQGDRESLKDRMARFLQTPGSLLKTPLDAIGSTVIPLSFGSDIAKVVATRFADRMRGSRFQWNKFDDILQKRFTPDQQVKMWNAADEENDMRRENIVDPTRGIGSLTPEERETVELLHSYGDELLQRARDAGMYMGEGVDYWTPRMVALIGDDGSISEPQSPGMKDYSKEATNLRTTAKSLKGRKYETTAETEAAAQHLAGEGQTAEVVRNIRTMPMAMGKLEQAIAGRELVNQVKAIGNAAGENIVAEGKAGDPNYFTINHPAMSIMKPRTTPVDVSEDELTSRNMIVRGDKVFKFTEKGERAMNSYHVGRDGSVTQDIAMLDQAGNPVIDRTPLYIRKDFEGPLRSVLNTQHGLTPIYNGLMSVKNKSMSLIMMSPMIHNAVEYGRAVPMMLVGMDAKDAGKNVLTLGAYTYFVGNHAKNDMAIMQDAISHGLVPIGHRGISVDLNGIADPTSLEVGKSWTAKALGAAVDIISEPAGDKVRAGVDAAGRFWHQTLLWDRIGDLQMGLYTLMKTSLVNKGVDEYTSATLAAHFANRYAGALPQEAMSQGAREILNLALFSRTFTMGNIGVMKDMLTGLPSNRKAMIELNAREIAAALGKDQDQAGDQARKIATSMGRRKAVATVVLDIGLMYVANSLTQDWMKRHNGDQTWQGQVSGYSDKLGALKNQFMTDPISVLTHPFNSIESMSATSTNAPDKKGRINLGDDAAGNTIYVRLPFGKIGEEFSKYSSFGTGMKLLHDKLSPQLRPIIDTYNNDNGIGQKIYDDSKDATLFKQVGQVTSNFLKAQVPWDMGKAAVHLAIGSDKTEVNKNLDMEKVLGPLGGLTYSKVTGGDALNQVYQSMRDYHDRVVSAMPDVKDAMAKGDEDGAFKILEQTGMTPHEINNTLRGIENPSGRLSPGLLHQFNKHSTDQERDKLDQMRR